MISFSCRGGCSPRPLGKDLSRSAFSTRKLLRTLSDPRVDRDLRSSHVCVSSCLPTRIAAASFSDVRYTQKSGLMSLGRKLQNFVLIRAGSPAGIFNFNIFVSERWPTDRSTCLAASFYALHKSRFGKSRIDTELYCANCA